MFFYSHVLTSESFDCCSYLFSSVYLGRICQLWVSETKSLWSFFQKTLLMMPKIRQLTCPPNSLFPFGKAPPKQSPLGRNVARRRNGTRKMMAWLFILEWSGVGNSITFWLYLYISSLYLFVSQCVLKSVEIWQREVSLRDEWSITSLATLLFFLLICKNSYDTKPFNFSWRQIKIWIFTETNDSQRKRVF